MNPFISFFMRMVIRPKEMRKGFLSSLHAAYIPEEIGGIMDKTPFHHADVEKSAFGLMITGTK
jgi:hypothetical protein